MQWNPKDVKLETCRSSGPGGQNVNKLETAVRGIHEQIEIRQVEVGNGCYGERIHAKQEFDPSMFNSLELKVLEDVCKTFKDRNTDDIVRTSHNESGWTENEADKRMISYQKYAFTINSVNC